MLHLFMALPLIQADNTWGLWAALAVSAALAIWLEQKYAWAAKVTGCVLALVFMLVLANLGVVPTESPVYDQVWDYVVPLAVPMLLFNANVKKIGKQSGKMLIIYLISSVGTILGGFLGYFALRGGIPGLNKLVPMFVGTYTGGSVNYAAMSSSFDVPPDMNAAGLVADNLLMALYFFILIAMPGFNWVLRHYRHPYEEAKTEPKGDCETQAAQYWGPQKISLKDIALTVATALFIVAVSVSLANLVKSVIPESPNFFITLIRGLFGNQYLMITTLTMLGASALPKYFERLRGAQEIGTFLIYLFFAVIGAPASIKLILTEAPLLLVFALIIVATNLAVTLVFGKIFNFSIEEILVASNANIGGPTTAAAMAVSKGWNALIVPALLVGTLGYVIGNYYGILVGTLLP